MNSVTSQILKCSRCENSNPFFFELKRQRIMLITASSTLQTNYLPLTHVRFVRNLLYYLFGLRGVSEEGFERFIAEEGIYWTSYNKCYDREFLKDVGAGYKMDRFSRYSCGETYLQSEYNALDPEFVIVMGRATCEAVKVLIGKNKLKIHCRIHFCDYFYLEQDEALIETIRQETADVLGIAPPCDKFSRDATKTTDTNSRVHLNFQKNIYREIESIFDGSGDEDFFENTVEQYWIQNVVAPLRLRYYMFLEIWDSLENSVYTSFMNIYESSGDRQKDLYFRGSYERRENGWFFDRWQSFVRLKGKQNLIAYGSGLYRKANILRILRNNIVHNNGRLTAAEAKDRGLSNELLAESDFSGIWLFPDLIYITDVGIKQVHDFYEAMTDFLILLE